MRRGGIRTGHENGQKTAISSSGGAESGAVGADSGPIDPDLAVIIDAWPTLPEAVRRKVVEMVAQAGRRD
jgi:hypothetical protein